MPDQLLECSHCGAYHSEDEDAPPAKDDDAGWQERAHAHERGCAWIRDRVQRPASEG